MRKERARETGKEEPAGQTDSEGVPCAGGPTRTCFEKEMVDYYTSNVFSKTGTGN